jgi:hypothetical protein
MSRDRSKEVVNTLNFVDSKLKFCKLHILQYPGSCNTDSFVQYDLSRNAPLLVAEDGVALGLALGAELGLELGVEDGLALGSRNAPTSIL